MSISVFLASDLAGALTLEARQAYSAVHRSIHRN
jgi:hypothetical protein